jgi:hypothetical protein
VVFAFQISSHFAAQKPARDRVRGVAAQFDGAAVFQGNQDSASIRAIQ